MEKRLLFLSFEESVEDSAVFQLNYFEPNHVSDFEVFVFRVVDSNCNQQTANFHKANAERRARARTVMEVYIIFWISNI